MTVKSVYCFCRGPEFGPSITLVEYLTTIHDDLIRGFDAFGLPRHPHSCKHKHANIHTNKIIQQEPRRALGMTWLSYLSQDITEVTSPFGIKKTKPLLWLAKAPSNNVEHASSNLFLFFSMRLPEVILVFISSNFSFSKDNSLKSSGKLTWLRAGQHMLTEFRETEVSTPENHICRHTKLHSPDSWFWTGYEEKVHSK